MDRLRNVAIHADVTTWLAVWRLIKTPVIGLALCWMLTGCGRSESIDIDVTADPIRFIIDHHGWPRPFSWPRVTEFAIASEQTGAMWQLASSDPAGVPARELAIVYGEVSPGFTQVFPENNATPKPLQPGRMYFAAAGGPKAVYKIVFALPLPARKAGSARGADP